jgi:hypothetical protein
MERLLDDPKAAYIVKSTHLFLQLDSLLETGRYRIDHAFIPIRNIDDAAASRIRVHGETPLESAFDHNAVPGGLYHCYNSWGQRSALGRSFYRLMYTIAAFDIPHTLIDFPRLARDSRYLYTKLKPILGTIDYSTFRAAFDAVVDLSLIHQFNPEDEQRIWDRERRAMK